MNQKKSVGKTIITAGATNFSSQIKLHEGVARLFAAHVAELKDKEDKIPHDIFEVTKFLLEENVEAYESIAVLLKKGRFQFCLTIARTIIENSINIQYIYRDNTAARAKNYIAHAQTLYLNREKKYDHELTEEQREVINYYKSIKKDAQKGGTNENHWDGKSPRRICTELGLDSLYEDWYTRLSGYIHSQYRNTRDFERGGPYNDFLKRLLFKSMPVLTLQTLKVINDQYDLLDGFMMIADYPHEGAMLAFSVNNNHIYECVKCGSIPEREAEGLSGGSPVHKKCGGAVRNITPKKLSFADLFYSWKKKLF